MHVPQVILLSHYLMPGSVDPREGYRKQHGKQFSFVEKDEIDLRASECIIQLAISCRLVEIGGGAQMSGKD